MANPSRAKSCTACRQVKLSCDARKKQPGPCTRCSKRNVECRFDPNFKRISTRKIVQEITNGVRMAGVNNSHPNSDALRFSQPAESSPESSQSRVPFTGLPTPPEMILAERDPWLQLVEVEESSSYDLGNVLIDSETARELFRHFERYYAPHAPFLQPITTSLTHQARSSPLLFWTIILCSSERHGKYADLYVPVAAEHKALLSPIVHTSIQSVDVLHALLLLCLWPVPKIQQQFDPSWDYIGMTINAAMHLNCHLPPQRASQLGDWRGFEPRVKDLNADTLNWTWLSCFDIGTRVGEFLGFPPPLSSPFHLKSIARAREEASARITPVYRAILDIRQVTSVATMQLEAVEDTATHFSMTQMFDSNLDTIKQTYRLYWTSDLEVNLQAAKLYLYAMTFTVPHSSEPSAAACPHSTCRDLVLRRGLQSASSLISTMTEISLVSIQEEHPYAMNRLTFYPKPFFTNLFFACVFLFRVLLSYNMATHDDTALAITRLADAHKIFQSFSAHRDLIRAAITIETLVAIIRDGPKGAAGDLTHELVVTSRLGASMMYDATFRCAQHRNRHPVSGKSGPIYSWKKMQDREGHRLPSAPEQRVVPPSAVGETVHHDDTTHPALPPQMTWLGPWDTYLSGFGVEPENSNYSPSDNADVWDGSIIDGIPGYQFAPESTWTGIGVSDLGLAQRS